MNPFVAAVLAALLFGGGTPIAKRLLPGIHPFALSGLLYLGAGLSAWAALAAARRIGGRTEAPLARSDALPALGTILLGGILGPCLLFYGLARTSALVASLLLNLEVVFTVLIAVATGESLSRREMTGCVLVVAAAGIVTFDQSGGGATTLAGALAVAAACAAWGGDNNVVRAIAAKDPIEIVRLKGLAAAPVSLFLAALAGASLPGMTTAAAALLLGAISYGASVALFVRAVRGLGAARTGALFATAPFAGAIGSVLLGDPVTPSVVLGGALMAVGVRLLIASGAHVHEEIVHEHPHVHDENHRHVHDGTEGPEPHSHPHRHDRSVHAHAHDGPHLHVHIHAEG